MNVDEGPAQRTFSFAVLDPGDDTFSVAASCGTAGTPVAGSVTATSFKCVFPDGLTSSVVSVRATDSDGDSGPHHFRVVTVRNVAPTATLDPGNDLTVDAGPAPRTFSFTVSDPGDDTFSVAASCGTAGTLVAGSVTTTGFQCVFADGPASSTVSVTATDSDGASGPADTQTVTVRNAPPVGDDRRRRRGDRRRGSAPADVHVLGERSG